MNNGSGIQAGTISTTGISATPIEGTTPAASPLPDGAVIVLRHTAATAKPTTIRVTGLDLAGNAVFPTTTFPYGPELRLDVPLQLVRLRVEYIIDGQVDSLAIVPIELTRGAEATVQNPAAHTAAVLIDHVEITPADPRLAAGTSQAMSAVLHLANGETEDGTGSVSWNVDQSAVAMVSSAGGTAGRLTAVASGGTTLHAVLGGVAAETSVTVTSATLSSITVTPTSPSLALGTTLQLTVTGTFSDGTHQDLTSQVVWSVEAGVTVSPAGLASATAVGVSAVTASLLGQNGTTHIAVADKRLTSIVITAPAPTFAKGTVLQLVATGTFSDATTQDLTTSVTWSSQSGNVAISNVARSIGLASGLKAGPDTVTATRGAVSGDARFTVTAATLASIAVTPADPAIPLGLEQQFVATGTFSDGTTQPLTDQVSWTTDGSLSISNVGGSRGNAQSGTTGPSTVTATIGAVSGVTHAQVVPAVLTVLQVSPANPQAAKGTSVQMVATGTFSDNHTADLTSQVTWSATAGASITPTGRATGTATGTSTITATRGAVHDSTTLTVTAAALQSIQLTPPAPSLPLGTGLQLTATGTYSDGTQQPLTATAGWVSSLPAVATVVGGALQSAAVGDTTITATADGVSGSTTVHVTAAALTSIDVTSSSTSVALGTSAQLTATGHFTDGTTANLTSQVTWSVDVDATVSASGSIAGIAKGTATFTAVLQGIRGQTSVDVTDAVLTGIQVTPIVPVIPLGFTQQFTATGVYSDGSSQDITPDVTWTGDAHLSVSNAIKGLGTTLTQGDAAITATVGAISGTTTAHVTTATLSSIEVTPATPTVARGTSVQMTATGTFSDGTTQDISSQVAWTSTASAAITPLGLATGTSVGTATLTATRGAIQGQTDLTVSTASLTAISVTPIAPVLGVGQTTQMTVTGTFSDGSTQDLTATVGWTSGANATVSPSGLVTATTVGDADVTATSGAVSGSTAIHVTRAVLTGITVTPADPSIPKGATKQFAATGTFSDGSSRDLTTQVTWTASGTHAAISNTAPTRGRASALSAGSSTITAAFGLVSGQTTLTISAASLQSVTVTPVNPAVARGASRQMTATATFSDATTLDVTSSASWISNDTSVVTVGPSTGLAVAVNVGQTSLQATYLGVSGTQTVTVSNATLQTIAVTPANPSIAKGTTLQFVAVGTYSDNSTVDLTSQVTWSTGVGAVSVSNASGSNGLATANSTGGPFTVSATLGGVSGGTSLTVAAKTLVRIDVTPPEPALAKGTTQQMTATGTYSDASTQDLTSTVNWTSSVAADATVSAAGLVTASTATIGGTIVTATLGPVSGATTVNVIDARLTAITVTPANPSNPVGTTRQFIATGTFTDGVPRDISSQVSWSTTDGTKASVTALGLATALSATAPAPKVRAALAGVTGNTNFNITAATLVSIDVTPFQPTVPIGAKRQMTATATYSDSSTADVTTAATWSSGSARATVSLNGGLVTAVSLGQANITATIGPVSGSTIAVVTDAALVSIAITSGAGGSPDVAKNSSRQLIATGTYTDGTTLNLTSVCVWSSDTPAVISISDTAPTRGKATANAIGTAALHASYLGVTGDASATVSERTDLIDVTVDNLAAGNNSAATPRISGDGTRIVYNSSATDLIASDTNTTNDIFVRTGVGSATPTTIRVNVADSTLGNVAANQQSLDCHISQNGDFVVFSSFASNLTPSFAGTAGVAQHVFRRQISTNTTLLVDENRNISNQEGCVAPVVSADGRYVAFRTGNANLYGGSINQQHVVRRDMNSNTFAIVDTLFNSLNLSNFPDISDDGRWIAYETRGSLVNFGWTDNGSTESDVVLRDMNGGQQLCSHTAASTTTAASGGGGSFPIGSGSPGISGDGRYVAYQSDATNIVNGDTNGCIDIFRFDSQTGTNVRVSVPDPSTGNTQADGNSSGPRLSHDGRYVIFASNATNLVLGDDNGAADIFIHDCTTGTTVRVSVDPVGLQGNGANFTPDIDDLGDVVSFMTRAPNLDTRIQNGFDHIIKAINPPPQP